MYIRFWWANPKERNHLEDIRIEEGVILKRVKESGLHSSESAQIQMRVSCECGNEPSGL